MVAVQTTTDEYPPLGEHIELRRLHGLDTYDEWWEGVYRIVTGPSPEHGELLDALAELLLPLVRAAGLKSAAPVNIGVDKLDCRVPDRAIYAPDTPRTSPAFLATALLVIEVLSPGEQSGAKLDFYEAHGVREYLEIDLARGRADLWRWVEESDGNWDPAFESEVLPGLSVRTEDGATDSILTPDGQLDVRDYRPA